MTIDIVPVRRALISVSDKAGLVEQARALSEKGVDLVSTGGTKAAIAAAGLAVRDVSDITGFPEMMDGRVKTLHPGVHGGLLARRDTPDHMASMKAHDIVEIDLLYVNLYPFEATVAAGSPWDDCIENIDIGGPAMLRAASKNHEFVAVCTDAEDLAAALAEIAEKGGTTLALRKRLAAKTYARTAAYDAAISNWLFAQLGEEAPAWRAVGGKLKQSLRYGENPHQQAAFYVNGDNRPGVASVRQVQGKELSYNNLNDTDAAYELVAEFDPAESAAVAIIKHANPCGVALGVNVLEAYQRALACDSVSAFGGVVALNRKLDRAAAEAIAEIFTEVVIAPDADEDAIAVFAKKKNLRLLIAGGLPDPAAPGLYAKTVAGGLLVQSRDNGRVSAGTLRVVTQRAPDAQEIADMVFAFRVAKHVKSNAIVYAKDGQTAGVGAGQMSRVDSARIARRKAEDAAQHMGWKDPMTVGSVCASDAFFPFADGLMQAVQAGATAVIQPGGSMRDDEVIKAADDAGLAMVFTGMRHFRH
ncbi:MAG: bifunctional phosphoribosylaminoimidazolecarboxamide formyltransferase/IMP cyclohydrolase [Hyphomonadaceae bacterium]|nr:MAG: phosphoribosylaminoimidazolecarboxamide formyltransferase / IMP cyclohydrolase [Caulobacteraceae bacterium]MBT9447403.1 bifunctional phosphoribosylaminoimidazolecarboxamide formyltransferase/IMP cyclohydrolase [Hyphomonadaceae bacterium]